MSGLAASASASAAASPNGTLTKPGVNGPKPSRASGSPENETIVVVRPWKFAVADDDRRAARRHALDLVAPLARGLDRGLDGLGAGVHRQHAILARKCRELAGERPELVVMERAARERHAIELRLGGRDKPRVAVAEVQRGVRGERVEVAAAAVVAHPAALGARDRDGERVVVVRGVALGNVRGARFRGEGVLAAQPLAADQRKLPARPLAADPRKGLLAARPLAADPREGLLPAPARFLRPAEPHVERERQATRPAAGLEELRDVDDHGVEPAGAQLAIEARRARRHDDGPPDRDGVRAERRRLVVGQRYRVGHERRDRPRALVVERARRVQRRVRIERAEHDVDVVVARVGELDGQDRPGHHAREIDVRRERRARAMPGDERLAERQRVTRALLGDRLGQLADREAVLAKPALGVGRLGSPLRVAHPRRHERVAVDDPEVRREDEVRQAGLRAEHLDLRARLAQGGHEPVPLALRALAVDGDREIHPRVDRVGDVEVLRRAHEKAPAPGEI